MSSHFATTLTNNSSPNRSRVTATKVRMLFGSAPGVFLSGSICVALIVLAMSFDDSTGALRFLVQSVVWGLALILAQFTGILFCILVNRVQRSDESIVGLARYYVWLSGLISALWGTSSWILLPARSQQQDSFLLVIVALSLMIRVGASAVFRPVMFTNTFVMTTVFAGGLFRLGDSTHEFLALGYIVFLFAMVRYALSQETAVTLAIELSIKNEELLSQRTHQEQAARQAQREAEVARERAEKADRAKTTFIAAASHDLRQPLHALVQYVEHMKHISADPAEATTIEKIEDSVAAMEELLNAVLDFSKISSGSVKPAFASLRIDDVLGAIDTQVRPLAQVKGLAFVVSSEGGLVRSDEVLLERVLRNIAGNAVKYTANGTVTIRAAKRRDVMRVLVSGTGTGIARAEKERVFEEYYQVDNAARDRRKGLGLGLAIVRDLIVILEARLRIKSILGRGSTFALELPLARESPTASVAPPVAASADHVCGAFVVLIDDDPLARDGVVVTLKDFGCRVVSAASALEALQDLSKVEFAPQVIISDYRLEGGMTGLEAIALVVENQRTIYGEAFPLAAILISGDTSPHELLRVADAGYLMLHKPVRPEQLHGALNALLVPFFSSTDVTVHALGR